MKHVLLLVGVFFTAIMMNAQTSTGDYIYSSEGFEFKTTVVKPYTVTYYSTGLYTKDGKVLVSASKGASTSKVFYVLDGCETICSKAFQYLSGASVYIPSTVKNIAPDAILSRDGASPNCYYGIMDGCYEEEDSSSSVAVPESSEKTEVARYNIQGVRLKSPTDGVNIVKMSDGTAEKVLVK
jgi:hypothetical protein